MNHEDEKTTPVESQAKPRSTFWDKARDTLGHYKVESNKILSLGKLKWDVTSLQRRRNDLFDALGRRTFDLLAQDEFRKEAVASILEEIGILNQEIEKMQQDIGTAKTVKIQVSEDDLIK